MNLMLKVLKYKVLICSKLRKTLRKCDDFAVMVAIYSENVIINDSVTIL